MQQPERDMTGSPHDSIKWFLRTHFQPVADGVDGTLALDLFATYCEHTIVTRRLAVVSAQIFGRVASAIVPRSPPTSKKRGEDRRGGRVYLVRPRTGVDLVRPAKPGYAGTAQVLADLTRKVKRERGIESTVYDWDTWKARQNDDKARVRAFIDSLRLCPQPPHMAPRTEGVDVVINAARRMHDAFRRFDADACGWTYPRFLDVLGGVTRVEAAKGTASGRVAFMLRKQEGTDGDQDSGKAHPQPEAGSGD